MPKLSVMMPVRNGERHIEAALASLLAQRHSTDLDIIVVDDGSTDCSLDIVRSLSGQSGNCIRLFQQGGRGLPAARNAGLKNLLPETELVGFLDADDLSPEGRYARDVAHFEADPDLDAVYSLVAPFTGTVPSVSDAPPERMIQLAAAIFARRLVSKAGLFDESFTHGGDTDYLFRILEQEPKCLLLDTVGVHYRQHASNMSRSAGGNGRVLANPAERMGYLKAYYNAAKRRKENPGLAKTRRLLGEFVPPHKDPQEN